jgi:hypothetical protein
MEGLYLLAQGSITVVKSSRCPFRPAKSGTDLRQHKKVIVTMMEPEETSQPQVANVSQAKSEAVKADMVRMHQSRTESVQADEVGLQQSAAAAVHADAVNAYQSALGSVAAEEVLTQRSAIVNVQAEKASVNGYTGAILARNAEVHY